MPIMCVLCYEFAGEDHWADAVTGGEAEDLPLRARYRRLRIVAAVLSSYGLTVSDPGVGRYVVISDRKGASEMATTLPSVWQAAQRLSGRRIDALDEALLDALAGKAGALAGKAGAPARKAGAPAGKASE
jgi:hypothetical protein